MPDEAAPVLRAELSYDAGSAEWTATALGCHGTGVSPGDALDDLWFALPDVVEAIDSMGRGLTKNWEDRRDTIAAAVSRGGL